MLWPAAKLIVELDELGIPQPPCRLPARTRARDTRLLVARYRTVRVTHERLDDEAAALADEIRGLLRDKVVPIEPTG